MHTHFGPSRGVFPLVFLASIAALGACAEGVMVIDVPRVNRDVPTVDGGLFDIPNPPLSGDVPSVMDVNQDVGFDSPNTNSDVPNGCPMGRLRCGANCIDPLSDGNNCGSCGSACGPNAMCVMGMCRATCGPGTTDCSGTCRNTQMDPMACGACGRACPAAAQSTPSCVAGVCRIVCAMGFGDCDMNPNNGCEVDVAGDTNNCGACGTRCAPPNAAGLCRMGQCVLSGCNPGFSDCDRNVVNGCEASTQSDINNCGACGNRCGAGQMCTGGVCRGGGGCAGNPQWMPVSCTTQDWVWSMDRGRAMDLATANTAHVLATGCTHGAPQPALSQGLCSLDGTGYVSTRTFVMAGCDANWWHIGGRFSGGCGGHDGDTYRLLALGANDCYAY